MSFHQGPAADKMSSIPRVTSAAIAVANIAQQKKETAKPIIVTSSKPKPKPRAKSRSKAAPPTSPASDDDDDIMVDHTPPVQVHSAASSSNAKVTKLPTLNPFATSEIESVKASHKIEMQQV